MKKKKAIIVSVAVFFAALFLAGIITLAVLGFNLFGRTPDASFAYDGAVANGFTGSEAEFMSEQDTPSTVERRCYEDALASGAFSGSYLEFLRLFSNAGVDDVAAVNGAFASVVCVESEFIGSYSRGSGVIYSFDAAKGNAYIITNYHVVCNSRGLPKSIKIYLYGGYGVNPVTVSFVGGVLDYDIAVLKAENSDVLRESSARAAQVADSDSITVGERVYVLGNPNGNGFSATAGVVSVTNEYVTVLKANAKTDYDTTTIPVIRTDAAVNHGNSGGGLFNAAGELIGIVNARNEEDGVRGFGYAIQGNLATAIARNILDNGGTARLARLGVTVGISDSKGVFDELKGKYYIEEKLTVESVQSGAAASDLQRTDTLLSVKLVQGSHEKTVQLTRRHTLNALLFEARYGDLLELTYSRGGEIRTLEISFRTNHFEVLK